jgi:hypothetical protein
MNYKLSILFIIIASFVFSCEDKTVDYGLDKYFVEIVTAQNENEFLCDKGNLLVATGNTRNYASGDRVLINYTLLSAATFNGGGSAIRINNSTKIPPAKLTLSDESTIHSSQKEPVLLESIWLGSHYLNMKFYIYYNSITHRIGLLTDSTRLDSDTLRIYFTHNTNNDPPGYLANSYLSFDLKEVLGDPEKSRPIAIQINTSNFGNKTYHFEY